MPTCPNPACKRTFNKPLKTLNLQENATEPYDACPYCLTKVNVSVIKKESRNVVEKKPEPEVKKVVKNAEATECKHHLGYLSTRAQKEIPEECLVCKDIVECMLTKMRQ